MAALTEKEEAVLNEVKSKCTVTSSELEKSPPKSLSARDVRVAIQSLVTKGRIEVNDCLKFVPTRERQSESCPE